MFLSFNEGYDAYSVGLVFMKYTAAGGDTPVKGWTGEGNIIYAVARKNIVYNIAYDVVYERRVEPL